jgi:putative membrane protein
MRYLIWIVRTAVFLLICTFAVKNTDPVTVRYYLGAMWQAPLVLVMLLFFCLGALFGAVSLLGYIVKQRRELASLRAALATPAPGTIQVSRDGIPSRI